LLEKSFENFWEEVSALWYWSGSLTLSTETFLPSRYYSHGSTFSHSVVYKVRNLVKVALP